MADGLATRAFMALTTALDRRARWYRLPKPLGLVTLAGLRMSLRRDNLADVDGLRLPWAPAPLPAGPRPLYRSIDGGGNDVTHPAMGAVGARFGRNVPVEVTAPVDVLTPNPRTVSLELLTRERFMPAATINVLAAAWLQFEVHDWLSHGTNDRDQPWTVDLAPDDPWPEHPMRISRTPPGVHQRRAAAHLRQHRDALVGRVAGVWQQRRAASRDPHPRGRPPAAVARATSCRSTRRRTATSSVSTGTGGWAWPCCTPCSCASTTPSARCSRRRTPHGTTTTLFEHARLINAALIAKIHTVEWTPALLKNPVMDTAMAANWWGLAGERFTRRFGRISRSEVLSGIPGSATHHHGVPYAMTEEFVAVYRMHPLMPDDTASAPPPTTASSPS